MERIKALKGTTQFLAFMIFTKRPASKTQVSYLDAQYVFF